MKRTVIMLMCILVLLTSLTVGCGSSNTEQNSSTAAQGQTTAAATTAGTTAAAAPDTVQLPIATDNPTIRLTVVDSWYPQAPYSNDLPIFKELVKRTGVNIKWECLPDDQYWNVMKTRVAAATDLPDLFTLPDAAMKLGQQGLIIPLNDLIDKYAPDIKRVLGECAPLRQVTTEADGKIYSIAAYGAGLYMMSPCAPMLIRKDWVDKTGLQIPKNADELYKVLKAFKDQNVNGKGDVIPLSTDPTSLGGMWAFGTLFDLEFNYDTRFSSYYYPDDSNTKLVNDMTRPEAKDYFMWLAKLYEEGLLDKEFATNNYDGLMSKIANGKVGAHMNFVANIKSLNTSCQQAGDANANWYAVEPFTAMNGKQQSILIGGTGRVYPQFGISKDCKNPDIVLKVFDYFGYTKEGYTLSRFGVEGLSYTKDSSGNIHFTDLVVNNPNKLSIVQAMWSLGGNTNLPICYATSDIKSMYMDQTAYVEKDPIQLDGVNRLQPYYVTSLMPALKPTADETTELSQFVNDCVTFRDEQLQKFIMGQRDFSEWDSFISDWKKMGMDREEQIVQAMYSRVAK